MEYYARMNDNWWNLSIHRAGFREKIILEISNIIFFL